VPRLLILITDKTTAVSPTMHGMRMIRFVLAAALVLGGCGTEKPAEPPPMPSPELKVRTVDFSNGTDRPLPTLIYQPPTAGRHPLVVFSHGYTRRPEDYDVLLRTWARAGFVVAAPVFPKTARESFFKNDINDLARQPADVTAVITTVLALDTKPGDPLFGQLDSAKVAVGGHSLGAMTSVGLISSYARDKRVSASIILAGSARTVGTDYQDPSPSMLFVHGAVDRVVRPEEGRAAYDPYPGKKAFLNLKYGDHLGPYTADDYEQTLAVAKATTDYLLWSLRGDAEALKRLNSLADIDSSLS
jgi:dienelactone hydrolase